MIKKIQENGFEHIPRKDDEILQHLELKKKARTIAVSTDDIEVKMNLRQLGEPICCFGEDAADRRERLRRVLAVTNAKITLRHKVEVEKAPENEEDTAVWYHEGSQELKAAREWILYDSWKKAKSRLENSKGHYISLSETQRRATSQEYHKIIRNVTSVMSKSCDIRPIIHCEFSPNSEMLAIASWSGHSKVYSVPKMEEQMTFKGHEAKLSCVVWHPQSMISDTAIDLATSDHDGIVKLWSLKSEESVGFVEGHEPNRVSKLAFHPSGRFLATTCFDHSWRLWDLSIGEEILHQEGHSKEVYDICFHPDGSLVLSGGLDSYGRVWDLRSGRCLFFLEGHSDAILSCNWSDNGYHMATGSRDNNAKIWDIRQKQCIYTIPAHQSSVSTVKFQPGLSQFIMTSSFDRKLKLWTHPTWTPIKEMDEHTDKIMHASISRDSQYMATCSFDKTVKLWNIPK